MGCGASKSGAKATRWAGSGSARATVYGRRNLPSDLADFELRAKAEEIFILADKDHDGRLDVSELRDIMYRPEMAEQVMGNYMSGRQESARHEDEETDERVTLEEFLAEVKKTYDVSKKVAEKMLFIYERTLRERNEAREKEEQEEADVPQEAAQGAPAADDSAAQSGGQAVEAPPLPLPPSNF